MNRPRTVSEWRRAALSDPAVLRHLITEARAAISVDDPTWIFRCDDAFVDAQLRWLSTQSARDLPLYGVPFAVKDNIDVAGLPTTAACPAFSRIAAVDAEVVRRLRAAGAILLGKTNLDQFATGLVGTRSPYGAVPNSFDPNYVSGGSSAGSAVAVARGLVAFALGTDTAGSGRVPAGFNNIVGLKPTPGSVSLAGVLPACRTLDTVSIFALTVRDAAQVMAVIESGHAATVGGVREPVFQRAAPGPGSFATPLRVAVPRAPACDPALGFDAAFDAAVQRMGALDGLAVQLVPIDMAPWFEVARLLYDGPWVAERLTVVAELLERVPDALDPIVRQVIESARRFDAAAAFAGRYRLAELAAQLAPLWDTFDVMMVPTAPTMPTRAAVAAAPIERNSELGRFTNFVNLLGLAALAVPAAITAAGLPFGVTFIAPGGRDAALAALGAHWQARLDLPLGAGLDAAHLVDPAEFALAAAPCAEETLAVAVVGAHLAGMPLHGQLVERRCRLRARTRTAPHYRLYALPSTSPPKPGLVRVDDGRAIEIEVYEMPIAEVGGFLALIPAPLGLGSVQLDDGSWVKGFICEPYALAGARDISAFGGWRAYLAAAATQ